MMNARSRRDEVKHKLRRLRRLEHQLRFGQVTGQPQDRRAALVFDQYFDLNDVPKGTARYPLDLLAVVDAGTLREIIEQYMADVYLRIYGIAPDQGGAFDPKLLAKIGLNGDADIEDVKRRFRKLAKEYHPDTGGDAELFMDLKRTVDALLSKT